MKSTFRKTLSLLLALVMVMSLLPAPVFAGESGLIGDEENETITTAGDPAVVNGASDEEGEEGEEPETPAADPEPDPGEDPDAGEDPDPTEKPEPTDEP